MKEEALRLARAGFAVHWLQPKEKKPIDPGWQVAEVPPPARLERSYKDGMNVGVRLGRWSRIGNLYLHIIDLDVRKDDEVGDAHAALARVFEDFAIDGNTLPTVISGSGGHSRHYYILTDKPFSSRRLAKSTGTIMVWDKKQQKDVKKNCWEIELFGTSKQVVLPPSIHPDTDQPYRWLREMDFDELELGMGGPIVESALIEARLGTVEAPEAGSEKSLPVGVTIEQARATLTALPDEDYLEDRDGWLALGMALHHEFKGSREAFDLWCEYSKRSTKFNRKDQAAVWKSFKPKALSLRFATIMSAAKTHQLMAEIDGLEDLDDMTVPSAKKEMTGNLDEDMEDVFGKPDKDNARDKVRKKAEVDHELAGEKMPSWVRDFNRKHAVALLSGQTKVMHFRPDGSVNFGSVDDLHKFYDNDRINTPDGSVAKSRVWMQHAKRRTYPEGVVFRPNDNVKGAYNYWRGFSVEPSTEGSCDLFLSHLLFGICGGEKDTYDYLIRWFAHMIQFPQQKPGVAVVLRGRKGTGKDTVGEYVGGLFPHHHISIAKSEQLVGRFNAHQEKALLLHLEEGFWAGNKEAESTLKNLITAPMQSVEAKYRDITQVPSVLRLFISSNERWVVPATMDERRFCVIDVPDTYSIKGAKAAESEAYFNAIRAEMENGGRARLLDYLLTFDLTGFNVRKPPNTAALAEQKIQGLKNLDAMWFSVLQTAELPMSVVADAEGATWESDWLTVAASDFRDAYHLFMRSRKFEGNELPDFQLGKALKEMVPEMKTYRPRIKAGEQKTHYRLPPLGVCRAGFESYLNSKVIWGVEFDEMPDDFDGDDE